MIPRRERLDESVIGIGDLVTLVCCHGWRAPHRLDGYHAILRSDVLTTAPDPFGGVAVPLSVRGRRIPARRYGSNAEVRQAPDSRRTGVAVGGPATGP